MGLQTITFSATANTILGTIYKKRDSQSYAATIFIKGSLGGGTYTLQVSPDGGTTKYTVNDVNNTPITGTSTGVYWNYVLAGDSGQLGNNMILYVDLAGATSPTTTIYNYDNVK